MRSISACFLLSIAIAGAASCASRQPQDVDTELPAFAITDCSTSPTSTCVLGGTSSQTSFFSSTGTSAITLGRDPTLAPALDGTLDATLAQPSTPSVLAYLAIGLEWYPDASNPPVTPELDVTIDGLPTTKVTPASTLTRVEIALPPGATVAPGAKVHFVAKQDDFIIVYVAGRWNDATPDASAE